MGNLEARNESSAGYLRCMICDKPVNTITSEISGSRPAISSSSPSRQSDDRGSNNRVNSAPSRRRPHTTDSSDRAHQSGRGTRSVEFDDETFNSPAENYVNALRASLDLLPAIPNTSNSNPKKVCIALTLFIDLLTFTIAYNHTTVCTIYRSAYV